LRASWSLLPPSEQDVAERSVIVCSIDRQAASSSEKLDLDVLEPNRRIDCGTFLIVGLRKSFGVRWLFRIDVFGTVARS
jgi:hypothetical protein